MKLKLRIGLIILSVGCLLPTIMHAQLCEPIYKTEKVILTNAPTGQSRSTLYNMLVTVGQPAIVSNITNYAENSMATGFWSHYLKEPAAPLVFSSDGDYHDKVYLQWHIEGDRTGPPVTGNQVIVYRNAQTLVTLPIEQTDYQDFNVFPGMSYTYGVTVKNGMGVSHADNDIGFLNPNGIVTGHVETPSGNPVFKTKVILTPNLGRCALFTGNSYVSNGRISRRRAARGQRL